MSRAAPLQTEDERKLDGLFLYEQCIFKTSVNGRKKMLSVNQPGRSVAELPVFDGGPYTPTGGVARSSASSRLPTSAAACASTRWWMVKSANSSRSLTPVLS
jgi:hypothetical protein